jgi:hypothetical protein
MELNNFMAGLNAYRSQPAIGNENNRNYLNAGKQETEKKKSNFYNCEEEDVVLSDEEDMKVPAKNDVMFDDDDVVISDENQNVYAKQDYGPYMKQSQYKMSYLPEEDDVVLSDEEDLPSFYIKPFLPDPGSPSQQISQQNERAPSKKGSKEIDEETKKAIKEEVAAFLHPYIARKITPGNENGDEKRLMSILLEKFAANDPKEVKKIALKAYAEEGAAGYIKHLLMQPSSTTRTHRAYERLMFSSESINLRPFRAALKEGIQKDFSNSKYKESQIDSFVSSTFNNAVRNFRQIEKNNLEGIRVTKKRK